MLVKNMNSGVSLPGFNSQPYSLGGRIVWGRMDTHEELKLLSGDHNFKYNEIFTVSPGGTVFLPCFFFRNGKYRFFIIRSLGLIMREPVQLIPMDLHILRMQVHDAC